MGGVELGASQGTAGLSFTRVLSNKCHRNLGLIAVEIMPWGCGRREEVEQATSRSLALLL